ncbi:MAG: LON peptidase substrate-binding domain-containing protein [Microthrixaceae bacterium]
MFPLGTVLLPGALLPLRVFEIRYQQLLADVLAGDRTFGVTLIERGHEVGGGDIRASIGTIAYIEEHRPLGRGRHFIVARGVERVRVNCWLPDDPYPSAELSVWPDVVVDSVRVGELYESCTTSLRQLLAGAVERGHHVAPSTFEAPDDVIGGSYVLSSVAPIGAFDQQKLLAANTVEDRLTMLAGMISDQRILLIGDMGEGSTDLGGFS